MEKIYYLDTISLILSLVKITWSLIISVSVLAVVLINYDLFIIASSSVMVSGMWPYYPPWTDSLYYYYSFYPVGKANSRSSSPVDSLLSSACDNDKFRSLPVDFLLWSDWSYAKLSISVSFNWSFKFYNKSLSEPDYDIQHNNSFLILCRFTLWVWLKTERSTKQNSWNANIFELDNLLKVSDIKYIL